ncbi:MAG: molybdopterin-guanine dinucleotide biosynthesis protein B [Dehalococcoidia bacterium]|nr:molybdopterin-guanine dinucleotide biosynthesis protein B [Dehalococcoidia bacterium]
MKRFIAISGPSNSGKTTLILRLIEALNGAGLTVGAVKDDPHGHATVDTPGKDSWRFRAAGAEVVQVVGPTTATFQGGEAGRRLWLQAFADCDIVIGEGFKGGLLPRIEVVPAGVNAVCEPGTLALVGEPGEASALPTFSRDDVPGISSFLAEWLRSRVAPVAILAGGDSTRMGRDKATIELPGGGTPLERTVATATGFGARVLVASRHRELHESMTRVAGVEFVEDGNGGQHPARGIAGALEVAGEGVIAVPCDSPGLRSAVLERLDRNAERTGSDFVAFAPGGRLRPLPGFYAPGCLPHLHAIASASRPLWTLAALVSTTILSEHEALAVDPTLESFRSLNTPDDWDRWLAGREVRGGPEPREGRRR